jgi:hypothetical protein
MPQAAAPKRSSASLLTCNAFASGHLDTKKWVRNPIGEGGRVIHPVSVTLNQRNNLNLAPFDAALPYTAAAALSLGIGNVVAFPRRRDAATQRTSRADRTPTGADVCVTRSCELSRGSAVSKPAGSKVVQ